LTINEWLLDRIAVKEAGFPALRIELGTQHQRMEKKN
jgi:hypothetical protein